MNDLEERVYKFQTGELPGQPMSMHMGTSYLVNDLWQEIKRLRRIETIAKDVNTWLKQSGLMGTAHQRELEKALNE